MNFLFAIKLSSDFLQGSSIKNYEKIILKFVVLSIALARLGTILPIIREITLKKKCKILESKWECTKRSIYITINNKNNKMFI